MFHHKLRVEQIMEQRGLARSTIFEHLAKLVKAGEISARGLVEQDKIDRIVQTVVRLRSARLRDVKNQLPDISYDEIKVIIADKTLVDI